MSPHYEIKPIFEAKMTGNAVKRRVIEAYAYGLQKRTVFFTLSPSKWDALCILQESLFFG